jgi:hypothetical protein
MVRIIFMYSILVIRTGNHLPKTIEYVAVKRGGHYVHFSEWSDGVSGLWSLHLEPQDD